MEQTYLERLEKLEQLRVIENGYKIKLFVTEYNSIGVDTLLDYEKIKQILENN
jgi:3-deoxy-manno-octulosonate cytidylyltransferase (CMP-KDO synthetase)